MSAPLSMGVLLSVKQHVFLIDISALYDVEISSAILRAYTGGDNNLCQT